LIAIITIIIATVLIIYGIATWNDKYITTCTITHYEQSFSDCEFKYYTPGNKNCSKQTQGFVDGMAGGTILCDIFKSYGLPGTSVGPTVPCLVNTDIDWSVCPENLDIEDWPYFNYLAKISEAHLCVIIGCLIILLNSIVLVCYIFYNVQIVNKLNDKFKTPHVTQPLIQ